MRHSFVSKTILFFALAALLVISSGVMAQDEMVEPADLNGTWESISCEHRAPADQPTYLKRHITFEDGTIGIRFHQFADSFCEEPTFTFFFGGTYEITGASAVAEGAVESIITIDDVRITPDTEDMVAFFNSAEAGTCGAETWEVGVEQSISETGCSVMGVPAGLVTTEYEIFHILDNFLFFAARPLDGSFLDTQDKRPGALLVPLYRGE